MAQKSSIIKLPKQIRVEIDKLLSDGVFTIDQIIEHIRSMGGDVSRSAIGRYSKKFNDASKKMREAREISTVFAQELGDLKDDSVGRQLTEMLRTVVFQVLIPKMNEDDPTVKPADLMMLARAIKDLGTTSKLSADMELKIRKEAQEEANKKAEAAMSEVAKKNGFSDENVDLFRKLLRG